jgi:hypothetical protein
MPPAQAQAGDSQPLSIYLLSDGTCEVRGQNLPCSDAPIYIRDVLKIGKEAKFSILARGTPPYESTAALFEALRDAGFKYKIGYVNVQESEQ